MSVRRRIDQNDDQVNRSLQRATGVAFASGFAQQSETEEFDHEVKKAERRGLSRTLLAIARAKSGRPDPYMRLALENYHRGVRDRAGADADS